MHRRGPTRRRIPHDVRLDDGRATRSAGRVVAREVDGRAAIAGLSVPLLVSHGKLDMIVLPSMTEEVLRCCKHAEVSWYEDVGHMPFWEAPERFNRELARFASTDFSPA